MNILIVGDSWSKPDSYTEPMVSTLPGNENIIEKFPLEYYLIKEGHTVYNRGEGGKGNLNSLKLADYFLKTSYRLNLKIDLVIFINTDLSRDRITVFPEHDYPRCLHKLTEALYQENLNWFNKIKEHYKGKWAVIGGNSPVLHPEDFTWVDFFIEDWRAEILGYKLPPTQWLYDYPFLELNMRELGLDAVIEETKKIETIFDTLHNRRDLFPDASHPNYDFHEDLGKQIIDKLKNA